jgi:hypothetical protein
VKQLLAQLGANYTAVELDVESELFGYTPSVLLLFFTFCNKAEECYADWNQSSSLQFTGNIV